MTRWDQQNQIEQFLLDLDGWVVVRDMPQVLTREGTNDGIWLVQEHAGPSALIYPPLGTAAVARHDAILEQVIKAASTVVTAPTDEMWVFEAMRSTDENGVDLLDKVIDGLNQKIGERAYRFIDQVLVNADAETMSRHVLLALARGTFPVRARLSEWQPFLRQTYNAFEKRGLDAQKLLTGLVT